MFHVKCHLLQGCSMWILFFLGPFDTFRQRTKGSQFHHQPASVHFLTAADRCCAVGWVIQIIASCLFLQTWVRLLETKTLLSQTHEILCVLGPGSLIWHPDPPHLLLGSWRLLVKGTVQHFPARTVSPQREKFRPVKGSFIHTMFVGRHSCFLPAGGRVQRWVNMRGRAGFCRSPTMLWLHNVKPSIKRRFILNLTKILKCILEIPWPLTSRGQTPLRPTVRSFDLSLKPQFRL